MDFYEYLTSISKLKLGGICLALFLAYDYWKKLYFRRHGIPGPFPLPIVGTLLSFTKGFTSDMLTKKNQYGKVYGIAFTDRSFVIHDLDMLQEVLISRFSSFPNHSKPRFEDKPFNKAITVQQDNHWRDTRSILSPAFSGSRMKQMTPLIKECCDQLVEHFGELSKTEGGIQCKDLYGAYSMDAVASTFFGMQIDSQKDPSNPFVKYAKEAFDMGITNLKLLIGLLVPGMAKLYNLLGIQISNKSATSFFIRVINQAIERRKKEENKRKDMLQLMIDAHKLDSYVVQEEDDLVKGDLAGQQDTSYRSKKALDADEIMANAVFFLIAGYDTTSSALCMSSYLLAMNKQHQEKLIQEVDKFAPRREDVTYEILSKMEYLDGVVRESLRLYPPAAGADRCNDKGDIVIKGTLIPKGFSVFIPIYAIQHDPEYWDEPEEFRPQRFFKENRASIHSVSWLPFGNGPRSCIGMRLALMEVKFALVRMLQEFTFETCAETEIPPVLNNTSLFISPPNGVKLQVVPRKKSD